MSAFATIHVGLKTLGIAEDDARDLYERQTGKRSLKEMSPRDHEAVIGELRRLGFKQASRSGRTPLTGRYAKKLQALWIGAWNLGIVENRDDRALIAFVKRQTGIEHVRFVRYPEDATMAIEALKAWMAREAGVDWSEGRHLPEWLREPGARIAMAQWAILARAGAVEVGFDAFRGFVQERAGRQLGQMTDAGWRAVMNALGERVRKAEPAGATRKAAAS